MSECAGLIPVDKPEGPTSHDIVARARRALGTRRIGHTGTLDPFASGLLLLCVGWATRLAEYHAGLPKTYRARMRLGAATDTDDRTGEIIATSDAWKALDEQKIRAAFEARTGTFLQTPPRYSARKVEGERLYRLARRGEDARAPAPTPVTVHRMVIERIELPEIDFEITCSAGTYVRAIARDIGLETGTYGYLVSLRRTAIGPCRVEQALSVGQLSDPEAVRRAWIAPIDAVAHLPGVTVSEAEAERVRRGMAVAAPGAAAFSGPVVLRSGDRLLAMAEQTDGWLQPRKVFT